MKNGCTNTYVITRSYYHEPFKTKYESEKLRKEVAGLRKHEVTCAMNRRTRKKKGK